MALTYREIDPKNADEVYAFNLCHEYSFRDSSSSYSPDTVEQRQTKSQRIADKLLSGEQRYFCLAVFDGAKMIGAIFQNRMEIDKQPACHIHGLWVHADFRGKGIARTLKERGEAWARSHGCKFMDSNVRVSNLDMIGLNEALGYEVARLNFRKSLG